MVVGQFRQETHLVVIGGGPGGCAAAQRAAELGVETVLVDAVPVPPAGLSLAALRMARDVIRLAESAAVLGVEFARPKLDPTRLADWTRDAHTLRSQHLEQQCNDAGVELIRGTARFEDARQVVVRDGENARLRFKRVIIATGSRMVPPPADWPGSPRISTWLPLDRLPETLLVIGAGALALETAGACAALGCRVSLVTNEPRWLPEVDADLVEVLVERLAQSLDALSTGTEVTSLRAVPEGIEAQFKGGAPAPKRRVFDHVLVLIGQRPHTDGLDLTKAQLDVRPDGSIPVDDQLRTANPRLLAVGDATGEPFVAHKAISQGRVAAEVVAGRDSVFDAKAIPCAAWTDPPLAWCGLTEDHAQRSNVAHRVCKSGASCRPPDAAGTGDGFVKLILEPDSGLVLGMGMVGRGAADVIGEGVLAIEMGAVATDLASVVHTYPQLSALISEAAQQAET